MTARFALRGVLAAVVTPFDPSGKPDAVRAIPYYSALLAGGCDGLNLLGTTGEGLSVSLGDRLEFMQRIAQSDLPRDRLVVGTGACALGDAVELTRAALQLGFAGALVIPPFYYRDATDDGIVRFYAELAECVAPRERSILLYNFPRMSGITFREELVARIAGHLGHALAGVKDSSNDFDLECRLHDRFPELAIFPGSEELLIGARERGLAGCISGSVALWPALAREVWREGDGAKAAELSRARKDLRGAPLIAAVRERLAREQGDTAWLRSAAPLG